jgi:hypothetical protein
VKHQETKTETREIKVVLREWQTCDMCGADITEKEYQVKEGRVLLKEGYSYPDGGDIKRLRADLCAECFINRLVPWLESQGVKMQTEEVDW